MDIRFHRDEHFAKVVAIELSCHLSLYLLAAAGHICWLPRHSRSNDTRDMLRQWTASGQFFAIFSSE